MLFVDSVSQPGFVGFISPFHRDVRLRFKLAAGLGVAWKRDGGGGVGGRNICLVGFMVVKALLYLLLPLVLFVLQLLELFGPRSFA